MNLLLLNQNNMQPVENPSLPPDLRYQRPVEDDLKKGLDLALEFKKQVDELHPFVAEWLHKLFNW